MTALASCAHFGQAEKDIELIETSGRKITSRGERITGVELEDKTEDGQNTELNLPEPSQVNRY